MPQGHQGGDRGLTWPRLQAGLGKALQGTSAWGHHQVPGSVDPRAPWHLPMAQGTPAVPMSPRRGQRDAAGWGWGADPGRAPPGAANR